MMNQGEVQELKEINTTWGTGVSRLCLRSEAKVKDEQTR
jgi:hypothetical protein